MLANKILIGLLVSSVEGARVTVQDEYSAGWGRSCDSLKGRLQRQQANLPGKEGTRALVAAVSVMRTLRRANARECSWANDGTVDTGAITDQAFSYLAQSPCAPQVSAALNAANDLSGAEKEAAQNAAILMLFDDGEGCSSEAADGPELDDAASDGMEEEMDETTDEIVESISDSSESSLIQEEVNPFQLIRASAVTWQVSFFAGLPVFLGTILFSIVMSMACGMLIHMLVRIFRFLRCKIFGRSCAEYAPATWFKRLVKIGCTVVSGIYGPSLAIEGSVRGAMAGVPGAGAVAERYVMGLGQYFARAFAAAAETTAAAAR